MVEWYFQPIQSKQYTKLGGMGKSRWFGLRVPIMEGTFMKDSGQRNPKNSFPATEIRWVEENGRFVMVHESKWGSLLGHFWILSTPASFEEAKEITGFKPYKS